MHKRWLLLMPLVILLMGCSLTTKTTQKSTQSQYGRFNGVTLDVSRHHYRVATLVKFIKLVSTNHGQFIQLHLSDDKDFAIENQVVGQTRDRAVEQGGIWRNKKRIRRFTVGSKFTFWLITPKNITSH